MAELAAVQAWMQRAILAGGAPAAAPSPVAGDARLDPTARIAIYARGYRARLLEALRAEYPALRLLAGDTAFDLFAESYIAASPSSFPSLFDFGAGFAAHLEETRPPGGSALPAQLARLERARAEARRARGVEGGAILPPSDGALSGEVRVVRPDTVRLLRLGFDFRALLHALDTGAPAALPEAVETSCAVARADYRVSVHALDPLRFAFLGAVGAAPVPVASAAIAAAAATGATPGAALASIALWLPAAGLAGLVAAA